MTFLKTSRLPVLAGLLVLLFMGFAGTSFGAVRFDVVPSPTEVINTGRSEVTGSINLIVRGSGNVTGTSTGGAVQIGIIYTNPAMQIDNTTATGIRVFVSGGFVGAGNVTVLSVVNGDINGRCSGFITLNILPGLTVNEFDFIRVEGVRGRIDLSIAQTPGTDLFADLQSINDPAANSFSPDRVRVAKSLDGMNVTITSATLLLCFPTTGVATTGTSIPNYKITISEAFARAFVDLDANNDSDLVNDRTDSGQNLLGAPANSTQFIVTLTDIPTSVDNILWPQFSSTSAANARLNRIASTFDATSGTSTGTYSFEAEDQVGASDTLVETFDIVPVVQLKPAPQTATGTINATVTLAPTASSAATCGAPGSETGSSSRPRFMRLRESDNVANLDDDPARPYATIVRCNCYLLFTFVVVDPTFNTGIAIANTTGDTGPFGSNEAPDQQGRITFYFYDRATGFAGSTVTTADTLTGRSFVEVVSNILPAGVTSFSGYIIAKADFQFCHGFAFIADQRFASIAHGYLANVIPDPAIKNIGGRRAAAAAGDATNIPAGESLNN